MHDQMIKKRHRVGSTLSIERVFHLTRPPAYWGTTPRLGAALALEPGERLLEVGCGTGFGARLARSRYVGLDTHLRSVAFAHRRRREGVDFVCGGAPCLPFASESFDKAVLINVVHHLDEDTLDRLFIDLRRVVRRGVVVLDADPARANRVERFFLAHDRGDHIRPRERLRELLARHFDLVSEKCFHNALHTIPQVLFHLVRPGPQS